MAALPARAAEELAQAPSAPAAPAKPPAVTDYEIGPEDILKVTVYGHEDLTQTILVQADGTFTFPLIGRVKGDLMTTKQLEQKIATLLARGFVRNPQVTVVVQEFRSKTIFVVGEVARPGSYPLAGQKMTLVEILAKAGPMTVNAGAEVIVVRPAPDASVSGPVLPTQVAEGAEAKEGLAKAEVFRINVRDIQAGELEKNIELRPKDTVFVPQAPKMFVSGEVRNPGAYAWFPGHDRAPAHLDGGRPLTRGLRRPPQDRPRRGRHEPRVRHQARRPRESRRDARRPPPPLLAPSARCHRERGFRDGARGDPQSR